MSVPGSDIRQPGRAESPPAAVPGSTSRAPRRRWWLLALGGVTVVSLIVLGVLAGTYQPLGFGGSSGGTFPGLHAAEGLRVVNTFGGAQGDIYIPPQRGAFVMLESIGNYGPRAVTIEAVTILRPDQAGVPSLQWPLTPAGPVLYLSERGPLTAKRSRPVNGFSLGPGQAILVGIPVRMSGPCYDPGWTGIDSFYVKERFLAFTHWVAIPLGTPLVLHGPGLPRAGSVCPGK